MNALRGWLSAARPIGIDCGSETIRLAQITGPDGALKLRAATCITLAANTPGDDAGRLASITDAIETALTQSPFVGSNAVLSLPSWLVFVRSLALPMMDASKVDAAVRAALFTAGVDASKQLLRHWVAGKTAAGQLHVIVFWADHAAVDRYIDAATAAGVRVRGVHIEASALIDCFSHVHRRAKDAGAVSLMVDVGAEETRLAIAQDANLLDAERIGIGGRAFDAAVVRDACCTDLHDARLLRTKLAADRSAGPRDIRDVSPDTLSGHHPPDEQTLRVAAACEAVAARLADAIDTARQAHDARFPHQRVARLVFVGGAATQPWLGKQIAQRLHLPGQIGDPILRLRRTPALDTACGIDRRRPQPMWAIAAGLSFAGPRAPVQSTGAAA